MSLKLAVAALAASAQLTAAFKKPVAPAEGMRLLKFSEEDPGKWVSEEDIAHTHNDDGACSHFVDITDIEDEEVLAALSTKKQVNIRKVVDYPSEVAHSDEVTKLIESRDMDKPKEWLEHFSSYHNRHCQSETGVESAEWLYEKVKEITKNSSGITVEQVEHSRFPQKSIIARYPGSKDTIVAIGAHQDSISSGVNGAAPGADDDGSGTVTILEALRVLVEGGFKPENTLEFHFYAGEEIGLVGSADIWADYKAEGKEVVAYVNQDMTGWSPSGVPCVITDYTDSDLNGWVTTLVEEYIGETPNNGECGYACSDHASANSNGFPAAFLFEDLMDQTSPYIHTPNDTIANVQWDAVERHVQFAIGYLVETSYV